MIRRDESGFTLIELVVASGIGTIIMLAALAALDMGVKQTGKVTDRENSLKRGRNAMTQIVSDLRSQTCGPNSLQTPIVFGDNNTVRFFAYTGDPTAGGATTPELRELSYDSNAKTITEKRWPGTSGPPATPTQTNVLLANVVPAAGSQIFTYYPFRQPVPNGPVDTDSTAMSVPLSATDLKRTVRIAVTLNTQPAQAGGTVTTTLSEDVVTRLADPNADNGPAPPTCV